MAFQFEMPLRSSVPEKTPGESAVPNTSEQVKMEDTPRKVTRRKFILGVIAGGGAIAAANYKLIHRWSTGRRLLANG